MKYFLSLAVTVLFSFTAFGQAYKIEGNEVVFEKKVSFAKGSTSLSTESKEALLAVKQFLEDKSYISLLRIEGHCIGEKNNQEISDKRAIAVGNWLAENGVDCKRLIMVGFGDTKPVAAGNDEANTRIVFANAELRGHAIGGMPVDGGGQVAAGPCK